MADLKTISLSSILLGDRLRDIDEGHAEAIAASISAQGLINRITVRSTPAAKGGSYTIVAGAHRYRAFQILELSEIDCVVVKAGAEEAQLIEIAENLYRNELSVIDRALFVETYRELWEKKHGEIKRGGDTGSNCQVGNLVFAGERELTEHVKDRLGWSERKIRRLHQIAHNLHPHVRAALRNTPIADNQAQLLKLAKMEPSQQQRVSKAIAKGVEFSEAVSLASNKPKIEPDKDLISFTALKNAWDKATPVARAQFLNEVAASTSEQEAA
ncbi:ParB/RepB/Spo0J family partition protein [Roseibium sediminis]|uniref:ParB/RepB/Spo0J family partition protein n=1 Tax=Roseibium sediminis TaxID=1775174 RepID=UPI00123D5BB8|nr:ParB/RepB/Spo0J family partition protein [Roseibium sediminis]